VQRGVVGPNSSLPLLAEAAQSTGAVANIGRLVDAGRRAGVEIIHHVAMHRSDMKGANHNARLFRAVARQGSGQMIGTDMVEIAEGVSQEPSDLLSTRLHGIGPVAARTWTRCATSVPPRS
jgi:nicotinamidase-related amidase